MFKNLKSSTLVGFLILSALGCNAPKDQINFHEPTNDEKKVIVDKLSGTWVDCSFNNNQRNYLKTEITFSGSVFIITSTSYRNEACSGDFTDKNVVNGHFDTSKMSSFSIFVLDMYYAGPYQNGDLTYSQMQMDMDVNGVDALGTWLSGIYVVNGFKKSFTEAELAQFGQLNLKRR